MTSLKFKEILCLVYSFMLFISGPILIGYSVVLAYKIFTYIKFVPTNNVGPFILLFLIGFVHLLLTWLAVRGPSKQHDFHIIMFIVITVILIIIELSEGIWSLVLRGQIVTESEILLNATFDGLLTNNFYKNEWISLEEHLHCCGTIGSGSYEAKKAIPYSCYNGSVSEPATVLYTEGCNGIFIKYIRNILMDISLAGFVSGIFQLFGVYVFYMFYKSLKEERIKLAEMRAAAIRAQQQPARNPTIPIDTNIVTHRTNP